MKSITIYGVGIPDKIRVHTFIGELGRVNRYHHIHIVIPFMGQSINGVRSEALKRFFRLGQ